MICTSRCTSAMSSAVVSLRLEMDLQASTSPDFLSVARRVVPNCPLPKTLPRSYLHQASTSKQLHNCCSTVLPGGLDQVLQNTYSDLMSGVCLPRTESAVKGFSPALVAGAGAGAAAAACRHEV